MEIEKINKHHIDNIFYIAVMVAYYTMNTSMNFKYAVVKELIRFFKALISITSMFLQRYKEILNEFNEES